MDLKEIEFNKDDYIKNMEGVIIDLLSIYTHTYEMHMQTGLSEDRCKEISNLLLFINRNNQQNDYLKNSQSIPNQQQTDDRLSWEQIEQLKRTEGNQQPAEITEDNELEVMSKNYYDKKQIYEQLGLKSTITSTVNDVKNRFVLFQVAQTEMMQAFCSLEEAKLKSKMKGMVK